MKKNNKNNLYKVFKNITGILLIIVGIFGLFLPIIQGIVFIITGIIILGGKPIIKQLKKLKNYLLTIFFNNKP